MSGKAIGWAREQRCSGGIAAKAVLLLLADYADREHRAWPSVPTLAGELDGSVRTVQRAIESLVVDGHLVRQARKSTSGRQTSSLYTLAVERPAEGCQSDTPMGDNLTPLGASERHPPPVNLAPPDPSKGPDESSDELSGVRASDEAFDRVSRRWAEVAPDRVARPVDRGAWAAAIVALNIDGCADPTTALEAAAIRYIAQSDDVGRKRVPRLSLWLSQERWRGYLAAAVAAEAKVRADGWNGPPEVRQLVAAKKGETYAGSWLAGARWDAERSAILTRTGIAAERLNRDLGDELAGVGVLTIVKGEPV